MKTDEKLTMFCHSCKGRALGLLARIDEEGVPPGEAGHDITYSHIELFLCRDCGAAQIEIRCHDCLDYADISDAYGWYLLGPADTAQLAGMLEGCPSLLSARCDCAVHKALRASCGALAVSSSNGARRAKLEVEHGLPAITLLP